MFAEVFLTCSAVLAVAFVKFCFSNGKFYNLAAKIPSIRGQLPFTIGFAHKALGANSEGGYLLVKMQS